MPNRNGQGPMRTGSGTGRGRGLCNKNKQPEVIHQEQAQTQATTELQQSAEDCKGPRNCATGKEHRKNGCGSGRGQR